MKIPSQYLPVMPYLVLKNAEAFLEFAKKVFSAEVQLIVPGEDDGIMHGELKIGDAVIMFGTASGEWPEKSAAMFLFVDNVEKTYKLALENGAVSLEAPVHKDYGYSAGLQDSFNNHWYITQPQ